MKKIGIFDFTKEGKGIKKEDYTEDKLFTLATFFKTFGRNFWGFTSLNFIYLLCNFPLFFGMFALSGNLNIDSNAPSNLFFQQVFGMHTLKPSSVTKMMYGYMADEVVISVPTTTTLVFFAITLLVIFTFGITNCGMAHVLRSYTRKDPVFLTTDFFETIARNWKQALPLGIIDIVFGFVSVYVLNFWSAQSGFVNDIMYYLSIFVLLIYFFMRFYAYTILITFDLSIFKIIKNSLIFALLGVKRNFVALLGIVLALVINLYIFYIFAPLGIIMPFIITISFVSFIAVYCTYPNIKKYMIDPFYPDSMDKYEGDDIEPVFTDRG